MSVKNITIGHPSQPGKLAVLNGSMNMYDSRGVQTVTNGQISAINTQMLGQLSFTNTITFASNGTSSIAAVTPLSITIPPQKQLGVFVRFSFYCPLVTTTAAGWNINLIDPSSNRIQTAQISAASWNAPIIMLAHVAVESLVFGTYVIQVRNTTATSITLNSSSTAPTVLMAELV